MSRYGNQYQLSDRAAMELARDRAKELEDLRAQVATLMRERDLFQGLAMVFRTQRDNPGMSFADADAKWRAEIARSETPTEARPAGGPT